MPSRELPSRPDLDHLKREARSLQQAARSAILTPSSDFARR